MIFLHHLLLVVLAFVLPLSATGQFIVGRVLYSEGNVTIDGKPVQPGERITTDSRYLTLLGRESMVALVTNEGRLHVFDKGVGSIPVDRIVDRVRREQPEPILGSPVRKSVRIPNEPFLRSLIFCGGVGRTILGDFVAIRWYHTDLDLPYDISMKGKAMKRDTLTYESGFIAFVGDLFTEHDGVSIEIVQGDEYFSDLHLRRPSQQHQQRAKKYLSQIVGWNQEAVVTRMAILELQRLEMDLLYDFYTVDVNIETLPSELKAYYLSLSERFDPRDPPPSYHYQD